MARNIRDGLPWAANLELWDPIIPDFRPKPPPRLPTWIQPPYLGQPGYFGDPTQQPPPKLPDFKVWDRLIRGKPETEPSLPFWIQPPVPPRLDPSPSPDPVPSPSPQLADIRSGSAGGLLRVLHEAMQQGERQQREGLDPNPRDAPTLATAIRSTLPMRRLARIRNGDDSRPSGPCRCHG